MTRQGVSLRGDRATPSFDATYPTISPASKSAGKPGGGGYYSPSRVSSCGSRNSPEGRAEAASGSASTGQEAASGFTPTNAELAELLHRWDA